MRRTPAEEAARGLDQAAEDLHWAKHLAKEGGYHIACFLAQQVGEKALKGFLYSQGLEEIPIHSIERLCAAAARYLPEFSEKVKHWAILDSYYIPTRYPNGLPDSIPARVYTQDAANDAVRLADEVVTFVRGKTPPPTTSS